MRKLMTFLLLAGYAISARADYSVTEIDFLEKSGLEFNGAGPLLMQVDEARNRLVTANTLSSSVSVIDCATGEVVNIPIAGRAFQHLKSEAMTISTVTGFIYLIGQNRFFIVDPDEKSSRQITTGAQFESIAVDEASGNVFIAGRESRKLGFFEASSGKARYRCTRVPSRSQDSLRPSSPGCPMRPIPLRPSRSSVSKRKPSLWRTCSMRSRTIGGTMSPSANW